MDNQPQPTKSTNKALLIVLIIVLLAIAGYGIYTYVSGQNNENTNNTNTSVNTVTNTNSVQATRPVISKTTNPQSGWIIYSSAEVPFEISFPANWHFTEPTPDHPNYSTFIVTASNTSMDGVEGIPSTSNGIAVLLYVERTPTDVMQYLTNRGVSPRDIPDNRVTIDRYNTETLEFTRRTVDATNLQSWDDAYSVEYVVKSNNIIKLVAFVGRSKTAIDNNQSTITAILQSVK
jgi:hypothetical protein